jgi:hypothetical protein
MRARILWRLRLPSASCAQATDSPACSVLQAQGLRRRNSTRPLLFCAANPRDLAAFAIVVDPKDDGARRFYARFGFAELFGNERRLYVPIESILRFLKWRYSTTASQR